MPTPIPLTHTPPMFASSRPIVMIGAGGIVNDAHLPAYRMADFPVAGIYDLDPEKALRTARRWGIQRVFPSLAETVAGAPAGAVYDIAVPAFALMEVLPRLPEGEAMLKITSKK